MFASFSKCLVLLLIFPNTIICQKTQEIDFLDWLFNNITATNVEFAPYDGWYNNLATPDSGAIDRPLLRRIPAVYKDGTYIPIDDRPNPITLSEELLKGDFGTRSSTGKTALLVFFGQQIVEEILDAQRPACPPEYFNIEVPDDHEYRKYHSEMPLLRTRFDQRTGISPGNPRQQLNEITPYLDGGLIYGITKQWSDQLRTYSNGSMDDRGRLASSHDGLFPEYNDHRLPMANPPPPFHHSEFIKNHETLKVSRFFKLGNPRGNENPFLLTFGILWFRWHNKIADTIKRRNEDWSSEKVFNEARKWVIATQQHIVVNKWLPEWLSHGLAPYDKYDASINPQIDQFFQAAAFRFGHTLVTPGVYVRDYARNGCNYLAKGFLGTNAVRTCNSFWRPQDFITASVNNETGELIDIDRLLMGMASQLCEKEDHVIVEDLRGNVFGPLEFPRRDLMAINVQRGRDHGLPDFNSAQVAYGLKPYTSFSDFTEITNTTREKLRLLYNDNINNIDPWIGGILQTTRNGPGPLFETVILDQFRRIRDGDRFWFENKANGLFSDAEISQIHKLDLKHIITAVTKMDITDVQQNVFQVPVDPKQVPEACRVHFVTTKCFNRNTNKEQSCSHLPILTAQVLNESCVQGSTYDYFNYSEGSFIISYLGLGTCIATVIGLAFTLQFRKQHMESRMNEMKNSDGSVMFLAKEMVGPRGPTRHVFLTLNAKTKQLEVFNQKSILLRALDCSSGITYTRVNDKPSMIIKAINCYDLVLIFQFPQLRENFIENLNSFAVSIKSAIRENDAVAFSKFIFRNVVTKQKREEELANFFRVIVSQAFDVPMDKVQRDKVDDKSFSIANTELTQIEFAEALGLEADSSFALSMFNMVDKDKNNFISFLEFMDFITIFSHGSSEDKARLLFNMYDVNHAGKLNIDVFKQLTASFLGRSQAEVSSATLNNSINTLLRSKNLSHVTELRFEDFYDIIRDDEKTLSNVNINLNIGNKTFKSANQMVEDIYGSPNEIRERFQADNFDLNRAEGGDSQQNVRVFKGIRFIERYSKEIFWLTLYTFVLLAIFVERAYYYTIERESSGLRQIAGYGVSVTRGAASAMMFTYSSLLVTMCRNLITLLRETCANHYFPFDFCVDFHKYIAGWAVLFTVLHIIGHSLNFYHISTQPADDLTCLFRNIFHATHEFPKFHYWCWGTITGITGILLTIILTIMIVFAQATVRRRLYKYFWYTHALYPVFFILMLLHGTGRLVQQPIFYYFFLGPVILFTIDQCTSLSRKKTEIIVQGAKILPSNVTMLIIEKPKSFNYKAGQWIQVACLDINAHEYHPFTLSSSPDEEFISLHIRAVGPWTRTLRSLYDKALLNDQPLPKLYIDGPFGEGHQDWSNYDVSILIASGIGVTPFASILKDIVYKSNAKEYKGKKVYFMWISRSQKQFEWLVDLLRVIEENDNQHIINTHIYITEFYEKYDLRTILLYIFEKHYQKLNNRSMFTNLQATTHFATPRFNQFFGTVQNLHPDVNKIGIFSCGHPMLHYDISATCNKINGKSNDCLLEHYFKTF